ncbi:MAG: Tat pathway signal sequence domain protein [Alphaproteobacteria bacterium]|nr:Tat pathway signal sequence domain protein [Alphaproteobacteria bacterium]
MGGAGAWAQDKPATSKTITLELNKLEPVDGSCRAYMVFANPTDTSFTTFKLDVLVFDVDGVIQKRLAVDAAPLRPNKTSVKLFDIVGVTCDRIDRLLLNDFYDCGDDTGRLTGCLDRVVTRSRANAEFFM